MRFPCLITCLAKKWSRETRPEASADAALLHVRPDVKMVYRKSRRGQTRRRFNKYSSAAYTLARGAMKGLSYVKSIMNVEHKYNDTAATPAVDTTGTVTCMTPIAEGDDNNARNGR